MLRRAPSWVVKEREPALIPLLKSHCCSRKHKMRQTKLAPRKRILILVTAASAVGIASGHSASATSVTFDLRFTGGPLGSDIGKNDPDHFRNPMVGTYFLDLWCDLRGTNNDVTDEALSRIFSSIVSTQINGGSIAAGGLTNGQPVAPFNDPTTTRN